MLYLFVTDAELRLLLGAGIVVIKRARCLISWGVPSERGWGGHWKTLTLSLSGKLGGEPAGVLPFDILVCEDRKFSISGVKLLLEIT